MASVAEAREAYRALRVRPDNPEQVALIEDRTIPGPAGDLPVRVYRPESADPLPALVYFHGGGWVIGDIESHDPICRTLANSANCVVVSVEYRLAPEAKFPAAADDAYAAASYVSAHAGEFGADSDPHRRRRRQRGRESCGGGVAYGARSWWARADVSAADLPGHRARFRAPFLQRERDRLPALAGRDALVLATVHTD